MHSNQPPAAATAHELHASHTLCEHQSLAFAWRARGARFASRCDGRRSIRPQHCARFLKPCRMMPSNR
eukprot:11085498-Lingulodinium_polyedra.AAC.1